MHMYKSIDINVRIKKPRTVVPAPSPVKTAGVIYGLRGMINRGVYRASCAHVNSNF